MVTNLFWALLLVGVVLIAEALWAELRDRRARRRARRSGRTLTARYGMPWR